MKKYGNDYRTSGKQFEYTGKWYGTTGSLKELERHGITSCVLLVVSLLIYVAGLMVNNTGSRIFWVLLPFVVMIFPIAYGIMGSISLLLFCKDQKKEGTDRQVLIPEEHIGHMTRAQYEKGIRRQVRSGFAIVGCSLFTCVADAILMFMGPEDLLLTRELCFEVITVLILILGSVTTVQSWHIKAKFTIFE